MFRAVITREYGEPWPATGMTTARWADIPTTTVRIAELTATQDGVYFHALAADTPAPVGGDLLPHVIAYAGQLYLEDGHHRVTRAALAGDTTVTARVLHIN